MQEFPHHYSATAATSPEGLVRLSSEGLAPLQSAAPREFGGPGDQWSPETLLLAAIADCFALSFKAIAGASRFDWNALECSAQGTLERTGDGTQFTRYALRATLTLPAGADEGKAGKLLHKAKQLCLITNSLKASPDLHIDLIASR